MRDDGAVVARCAGQRATVTRLALDVEDDRSLGHLSHRQNVANRELCLLPAVDELSCVETLGSDECLLLHLEPVPACAARLCKKWCECQRRRVARSWKVASVQETSLVATEVKVPESKREEEED